MPPWLSPVKRLIRNQQIGGSNPSGGSKYECIELFFTVNFFTVKKMFSPDVLSFCGSLRKEENGHMFSGRCPKKRAMWGSATCCFENPRNVRAD
jgi:hypothetical protein